MKKIEPINHALLLRIILLEIVFCIFPSSIYANEETSIISITELEGYVELRFREDEQSIDANGAISKETRSSFEQEIFILTHGSIYHSNFLSFDVGFGPIFNQSDVQYDATVVDDNDSEYNLTSRFSFLEKKPYPIVFYYNLKHPIATLSLTDRFQQEVEETGVEVDILKPLLPFNLEFEVLEHNTKGQGFDILIDDSIKQKIIRTEIPMGKDGYGNLIFNSTDLVSSSGFVSQPTNTTEYQTDSLSFDSRLILGEARQYQLANNFSYFQRSDVRPLDEFRYTPDFRWQHSEQLSSVYRLNYLKSDQGDIETQNTNLSVGFRYSANESTTMSFDVEADDNTTTGLEQSKYGFRGNVRYESDFSYGSFSLSGSLNYNENSRQVTANVPVRDLVFNFSGTSTQFLPNDNIILNSIRVFRSFSGNLTELVVGIDTGCSAGIDFYITSISARTRIENCNGAIDGDIATNIQYEYNPGGSVEYNNFMQGYQINLDLFQYANVFFRWNDNSIDIQSGTSNLALDETTRTNFGTRIDYPLYESITVGGAVNIEKQDGSLISFDRESFDGYMQFMLLGGKIRLSKQYDTIDYQNSTEDVDLERVILQFQARPYNKFSLNVNLSDEKNIGGSRERHSKAISAKLLWHLRDVTITGDIRIVDEQYDAYERDRSQISLTISRSF